MERDPAVIERLFARRRFGIKPGLETSRTLLERLGNPQEKFASVHVAGTNGKGSVCAMLDSMIRAAGIRSGRYTSPHLYRFNERFMIDGEIITDNELLEIAGIVERSADELSRSGLPYPTFFECSTAIAFCAFARSGVSVAVVETGLGGRLDATNLLHPMLSVITRIGRDHCEWLGDSLEAIAGEKAGIIKEGVPVVRGAMPEAAARVLDERAASLGCRMIDAERTVSLTVNRGRGSVFVSGSDRDYGTVRPSLKGYYQCENLATAVTAFEVLGDIIGVEWPENAVTTGLETAVWHGRFQQISSSPVILLDGAHNRDGASALRRSIDAAFRGAPVALVLGMCVEKNVDDFLAEFRGVVQRIWCVDISNPRNMGAERCAENAVRAGMEAQSVGGVWEAIRLGSEWAEEAGGVLVVCGSLFLVGEVLEGWGSR